MKLAIVKIIIAMAMTIGINVVVPVVGAQVELFPSGACGKSGGGEICSNMNNDDTTPLVQVAVNTLLYVAGVVAIIFVVMGGFKLVTSTGDAGKAASARNTILYALAGLVVAGLAFVIIQYIFHRISPGAGSPAPGGVT